MKISKITQALLLVSAVAIVLDLARLDVWGTTDLLYLIWNLFLAWIPYVISFYFIKKDSSMKRFLPIFIIWFLFFPNAPYLVTDVLHIANRLPSILWYDSLLFFLFGWIGLLLGMLSLSNVHQYFKAHFSYWMSEIIILVICLISSFGIYLGRFGRLNSWDLFAQPQELWKHSSDFLANLFHPGTEVAFVGVFTIFMYLVYRTVYILIRENIGNDEK
ncbi:hypothetical protein A3A03_00210 [Candidatus Nomurabacteria bacterium RIFCSPLOWO2_01_FULL_40_18]|uniref:DUF1361 domain-containing protein n=1 Tax=Candidatus Nomurabacteria bacterium RIFCSPLOWO2_01_FULL_40_18 TaxID=1801773 RepID=A0A1F6XL27_9BACT|nr:MAG: hypothetical protein A3A03_00210 [Candidatus Nomurabacteria bacterium RIFCSPLOWO2_01_FULL_40_18]